MVLFRKKKHFFIFNWVSNFFEFWKKLPSCWDDTFYKIVYNWKEVLIYRRIDKQTVVYSHKGILLSNKKEGGTDIHNMDDFKNIMQSEKDLHEV